MGDAASDIVSLLLLDGLAAEIDIPVLSALYRAATGDELSVLDVACLFQAIVFTIAYKIIADRSPVADLQALLSSPAPAGTTLALAASPPVQPVSFVETGTQSTGVPVEGASPLEVVTGCLLVVQGVAVFALGMSKLSGDKLSTRITYTLDLLTRTLRAYLEKSAATPQKYAGQDLLDWEFAADCFLLGGLSFQFARFLPAEQPGGLPGAGAHPVPGGGLAPPAAGANSGLVGRFVTNQLDATMLIMIVDALLSLGWGVWEVRNMCANQVGQDADHIIETSVELLETLTLLCCIVAHDEPNPGTLAAAFTFVSLRSLAAASAGIIRASNA